MISPEELSILNCIPSLRNDSNYHITSPNTRDYNCIAWAVGRDDVWYWPHLGNPSPEEDEYWPSDIPDNTLIETFIRAMNTEGFELTDCETLETGYEKIALYELRGNCTHAARQLPTGMWTSKMGPLHDIQHSSPYILEGLYYGKVHCIMKRKIR